MAFHKEQLTEPCRAASKTVQIKHVCITVRDTPSHTHTQSIVRLTKQSPSHVHHRLPATLVTPFMSELQDKFCLASASTHRHACRCTCVPVLLRLRAYRGLHPPSQRRKGGDPPHLPSLQPPRPVGPPLPHARAPRQKLQRHPQQPCQHGHLGHRQSPSEAVAQGLRHNKTTLARGPPGHTK